MSVMKLDDALEQAIEELDRGLAIPDVTAKFPSWQTELTVLLAMATGIKEQGALQPREAWLRDTSERLASLAPPEPASKRRRAPRISRFVAIFATSLVVAVAGFFIFSDQLVMDTPRSQAPRLADEGEERRGQNLEDSYAPETGAAKEQGVEQTIQDLEDSLEELDIANEELVLPELDFDINP